MGALRLYPEKIFRERGIRGLGGETILGFRITLEMFLWHK